MGGEDVDARLDITAALSASFEICALGSEPGLAARFARAGVRYRAYAMSRRASPRRDLGTLWQLVRLLREERPDLVHTFDSKPSVWGRIAARLAGVPHVVGTLPGLGSLYTAGWGGWRAWLIRQVYQPLQTLACHLSDLTIFQNEDDAHEFTKRRVVPRDRTAVIPGSGVRTDVFEPRSPVAAGRERAELRAELGIRDDAVRHGRWAADRRRSRSCSLAPRTPTVSMRSPPPSWPGCSAASAGWGGAATCRSCSPPRTCSCCRRSIGRGSRVCCSRRRRWGCRSSRRIRPDRRTSCGTA